MRITWITAMAIVTERFTAAESCWNCKFPGPEIAILTNYLGSSEKLTRLGSGSFIYYMPK